MAPNHSDHEDHSAQPEERVCRPITIQLNDKYLDVLWPISQTVGKEPEKYAKGRLMDALLDDIMDTEFLTSSSSTGSKTL